MADRKIVVLSLVLLGVLFSSASVNAATSILTSSTTAPVNNFVLNFSWSNSTNPTAGYYFNNITFALPTNLTAIPGLGTNTTNSTNVTSFSISGQAVTFGNGTSWTTEKNLWFAFNISSSSAGTYTINGNETYENVTGGTPSQGNTTNASLSVTFTVNKGTITLSNSTFSNYTYNGSSLIMNFTATPSAPTGNGIISDILNFTLWSNNTLVNSTVGQFGNPPITISNTSAAAGLYQFTFNISNSSDNNYTLPNPFNATLSISQGTPAVTTFLNNTQVNVTATYPNSAINLTANSSSSGVLPSFNLYVLNSVGGGLVFSNTSQSNPVSLAPSILGNGTYQIIFNNTANANWTVATNNTLFVLVNKGTPSLTLTISPSTSVSPNTITTASGSGCPTSGVSDVTCPLTRTFGATTITVTNPETISFSPGTSYTYTYSTGGGANWTSATVSATLTIGALITGGIASTSTTAPQTTVSPGQVSVYVQQIAPGSPAVVTIGNSDTKVNEIDVNAKNQLSQVSITVNNVAQLPSNTPAPQGKIFNQWNVVKNNILDTDISQVTIKFSVDKSWLTTNNVDSSKVTLQRYSNNQWNSLTTTKTSEDNNSVYYTATSLGLSYFAITGQLVQVPATQPTQQPSQPSQPSQPTQKQSPAAPAPSYNYSLIVIVVVVAIVVIVALSSYKLKAGAGKWKELKKKW